ncbi:glycosyltransferase family 4 protein [Curvibacter sp. CHRR-16]|uniref:glycosyltransferase family 4 protein n=1 Tax=Curvibacter sp. CHRR-16 TaxID=2835872 RepID=UPI001BDABE1F|nr:glycosyltransferase family 4 protein [Curvibacter sp. CHRR-16]MBT0571530.1 glycosyltransferase family 4 protein [Curvibacter sp. CHRR-16]
MNSALIKLGNALAYLREHGPREFADRLRYGPKADLVSRYGYALLGNFEQHPDTAAAPANTVNWFLSGFSATSGGHINIMRFVHALEARGYECRIVIAEGEWMRDANAVRQQMIQAFGPMQAQVYLSAQTAPPAYASIATGYDTAYYVRAFTSTHKKFYFVQDFEPWFSAPGSNHTLAEATYRFGFIGITAGNWLAEKLAAEYGMETHPFGFSYDETLYTNQARTEHEEKRVFFYARPETERRAFELGVLALHLVYQQCPQLKVVFAGGNLERQKFSFPCEVHGKLNVRDLGALYNSCDAALVLSMTNASLLPVELMACGTPVVSNTGAWVEWLLNGDNAQLASAEPHALASALQTVLKDSNTWQRLHRAGLATAQQNSWGQEADKVANAFSSHGCKPATS